jgi:hypothetical protein
LQQQQQLWLLALLLNTPPRHTERTIVMERGELKHRRVCALIPFTSHLQLQAQLCKVCVFLQAFSSWRTREKACKKMRTHFAQHKSADKGCRKTHTLRKLAQHNAADAAIICLEQHPSHHGCHEQMLLLIC